MLKFYGSLFVFLIMLLSMTIAQNLPIRQGSAVTLNILPEAQGIGIEVDEKLTQGRELTTWLRNLDTQKSFRTVLAPQDDGNYQLNYPLAEARYGFWMRYGTGIDTYSEYLRFSVTNPLSSTRFGGIFQSELRPHVPASAQPLGYAVFGFIMLLSLAITALLFGKISRVKTA
ncbi:MAG: hypothetical protein R2880_16795 [Deinococcales bacterium]